LSPLATPLNSSFILSPLSLAFHSSEELRLYSNGLTGSIASELGVLVNLSTFRLTEKSFHYTTQDCFTHSLCPLSLENLYLYDNVLSGKIPLEIAALTSLGESSINTAVISRLMDALRSHLAVFIVTLYTCGFITNRVVASL